MATLTMLFGGAYVGMGRGGKKATQTPPINASSPDEESFIKWAHPEVDHNQALIDTGTSWTKPTRTRRRRSTKYGCCADLGHGDGSTKMLGRVYISGLVRWHADKTARCVVSAARCRHQVSSMYYDDHFG
jgi:hypothetical protein